MSLKRAVILASLAAVAAFASYERAVTFSHFVERPREARASFPQTNPASLTPAVTAAIDRAFAADDLAPPAGTVTKTVPIVAYDGPVGYYGAAHVSGSAGAIARTTAVLWLDPTEHWGGWPERPLVPIARVDASGEIDRVGGVAVDALLWKPRRR